MSDVGTLEQALGPDLARHLGDWLEQISLPKGHALLEAGKPAHDLFVLLKGRIEVRRQGRDGPVPLGVLEAGALIGEVGFLDQGVATADLVALQACRLARLPGAARERLRGEDPRLFGQLMRRLAETMATRLHHTSKTVVSHTAASQAPKRRSRVRKLLGRLLGAA